MPVKRRQESPDQSFTTKSRMKWIIITSNIPQILSLGSGGACLPFISCTCESQPTLLLQYMGKKFCTIP
ncbi:hypothetical protein QQP08_009961 [Theobroma cacao]|nr:hypothetical protein QQP08_009961 [Theobroma cacao]